MCTGYEHRLVSRLWISVRDSYVRDRYERVCTIIRWKITRFEARVSVIVIYETVNVFDCN